MTEYDTFQILRKQPFSVLRAMVLAIPDEVWDLKTDEEHDEWFREQGWTFGEYIYAFLNSRIP